MGDKGIRGAYTLLSNRDIIPMPEYNIGFSKCLIQAADLVSRQGIENEDAKRTVLYLSKLACEIALKALLEKAGKPIDKIKDFQHNLDKLLTELGNYQVQEEVTKGTLYWVPASRIRSIVVDPQYSNATIGHIFQAEELGASMYPNQIRYGETVRDFPPYLWLKTAHDVIDWVSSHWDHIHVKNNSATLCCKLVQVDRE